MIDLIAHAVRSRNKLPPKGAEELARALKQSNIPQELIGNPKFLSQIQNINTNIPSGYESTDDEEAASSISPTNRNPTGFMSERLNRRASIQKGRKSAKEARKLRRVREGRVRSKQEDRRIALQSQSNARRSLNLGYNWETS